MNTITRLPHLRLVTLPASGAWTTLALTLPDTHKAYLGGANNTAEGEPFSIVATQSHVVFWPVYTLHASSTTGRPKVRLVCSNGTESNAELLVNEDTDFVSSTAAQTVHQREMHLWTPPGAGAFAYGRLVYEVHADKAVWLQAAELGDPDHPGQLAIWIGGHS
jgi:hypothetical protein